MVLVLAVALELVFPMCTTAAKRGGKRTSININALSNTHVWTASPQGCSPLLNANTNDRYLLKPQSRRTFRRLQPASTGHVSGFKRIGRSVKTP
jgi:hypothetical protein